MQIILDQAEKMQVIHKCLTTGMPYFPDYGFLLEQNKEDYEKAKAALIESGMPVDKIWLEDVQIEMLRMGFGLSFVDDIYDGSETKILTLELIEQNWDKVPMGRVVEIMLGDWDAETADVIMQCILFGEVTFG